ncbi:unnamed protein product [Durusdinium trenchii]|uniref:Uncharacterized protein n=1 Tax=Durusdinium trenchii TaxID=1381693 RepID=A0ABP0IKH2_9DINO
MREGRAFQMPWCRGGGAFAESQLSKGPRARIGVLARFQFCSLQFIFQIACAKLTTCCAEICLGSQATCRKLLTFAQSALTQKIVKPQATSFAARIPSVSFSHR